MADENIQDQGNLFSTSDYKLTFLSILSSTGVFIDIRNIVVELDIFEDIFTPTMTGSVTVGDGADILSSLQMHGNEYIVMEIDKPTLDKPLQKTFRIYKISNRAFGSTSLQNYTIHFCSEELILSAQSLVSKSYKGLSIDTMVKDILTDKLKVNPNKMKGGIFSTTTGSFDLIVPRMQPLRAIEWLTPKAYNTNENLFFFFENRDGFNFTSLENLVKLPSYATYSRSVKVSVDASENFASYNWLGVSQDFDVLKSLRFGGYSSSLLTIDLITRQLSTKTFGYADVNPDTLLNKAISVNGLKNRLGTSLTGSSESMVKYVATFDGDPANNPADIENWLPQTSTRLAQINGFKLIMATAGDTLMKAGMIINLIMPLMIVQEAAVQNDELRTGRYLVSSVHHKFINDIMTTVVELLSDSVGVELVAAADSTSAIQKVVSA